jgi:hypothetical protein
MPGYYIGMVVVAGGEHWQVPVGLDLAITSGLKVFKFVPST